MASALPLIFFIIVAAALSRGVDWRVALTKAAIVLGLCVLVITELLSPFKLLTPASVAAAWVLATAIGALSLWRVRRRISLDREPFPIRIDRPWTLAAVVALVLIGLTTFVVAVVAPPNTFDSMTYHMARVAHWAADQTVAFYPTNIVRQLYSPPWAEYAVLHLQLMSGGDHLANLVQWLCMVLSVVLASLVAQQLGAGTSGQLTAAIVVATLPMGILQASSTQTDYALGLWVLCCVSTSLTFFVEPSIRNAVWVGAAAGLALFTKGTAYLFLAPVALIVAYWSVTHLKKRALAPGALMILIPLVVNAPIYVRNELVFHNPIAPTSETRDLANAIFSPAVLVSNLARDTVLQFGTPAASVNHKVESAVIKLHTTVLHLDASDPRTTFGDAMFVVNGTSFDEDYAGDFFQASLALLALFAALLFWRRSRVIFLYSAAIIAAYSMFALYLRWQPWHTRLELPLLIAAAPLIGALLARRLPPAALSAICIVLLLGSVPYLVANQTRPMVGIGFGATRSLPDGQTIFDTNRTDLYFVKFSTLEDPYRQVAAEARRRDCHEIAYYAGGNDWEYPLWVMLQQAVPGARIDHVLVDNGSAQTSGFEARPCLAVATQRTPPEQITVDGLTFARWWSENGVVLYTPAT